MKPEIIKIGRRGDSSLVYKTGPVIYATAIYRVVYSPIFEDNIVIPDVLYYGCLYEFRGGKQCN